MIQRISLLGLLPAAAIALTLAASACSSGNDSANGIRLTQVEEQVGDMQLAAIKAQLLATLDIMDRAGLHGIDTDLQTASSINSQYLGTIRKVRQAVVATTWPTELKAKAADDFRAALEQFQKALANDDLAASKAAASKAHEGYHALSDAAWPYIAGEKAAPDND